MDTIDFSFKQKETHKATAYQTRQTNAIPAAFPQNIQRWFIR